MTIALQVENEDKTWSVLNRSWDRAALRTLMEQWQSSLLFPTARMRLVDERAERPAVVERAAPTVDTMAEGF